MAKIVPTTERKTGKTKASPKTGTDTSSKTPKTKIIHEMSAEELVVANFATLTNVLESLGKTLDLLLHKSESMAYHIIATEEVLSELVAVNGIDLASVNERIRTKIGLSTDMQVDPGKAIDVAAAIASPRSKQR